MMEWNAIFKASVKEEDYRDAEGLLHCGICKEAKEVFFPQKIGDFDRHPRPCACERKRRAEAEARQEMIRHENTVALLRKECFQNSNLKNAAFEHTTVHSKPLDACQAYVKNWEEMQAQNAGLLLWGNVGTGKTYAAAAIANALIEQEVPVHMRSLAQYLNASFDVRNLLLQEVRKPDLLILDDLGMERNTEYGLETAFQVIDERYRSGKPLIITTNLTLAAIKDPNADLPHRRIYSRLQEYCVPVFFDGENLRLKRSAANLDAATRTLQICAR